MPKRFLSHPLLLLYLLVSLLHLVAVQWQIENLILLSKPLLMPILAWWFWRQTRLASGRVRNFILLGLLFSCGGDTLLMFVDHGPQEASYFILGLGSFLLAQLCYIVGLAIFPRFKEGIVQRHPWLVLLFIGYWHWVLTTLWGGIPSGMGLPVAIYALAIVGMALMALNLSGRIAASIFKGLFIGVILFVISDTLIAFNKFGDPIPYARLLIMLTYLSAQLLIAWNAKRMLLEEKEKDAD